MALALAIEPLSVSSSVTLKPNTPLKTADLPTVACVLQFRISYLCVLIQLLGFLFMLVPSWNLTVGEDSVFSLMCMCLPLESRKIKF